MIKMNIPRCIRFIIIFSAFLSLTLFSNISDNYSYADVRYSGTSGTCNWVIDTDGMLTVTPSNGTEGTLSDWGESRPEWFHDYYTITGVKFEGKIKAQTTRNMFRDLRFITRIDISGLDTSQSEDMSYMFYDCRKLQNLDVTGFDTSNVTTMSHMFDGCNKVQAINVSGFNTSKVTDMAYMFAGCSQVTALDVSHFDTSKVTNMCNMFGNGSIDEQIDSCSYLETLDTSHFDTSNVTDMSFMFEYAMNLRDIDVTSFDTSKVTTMKGMFTGCETVTSINVSGFDTSNVTDMTEMFMNCKNLTQIDISMLDTSKVENMVRVFSQCDELSVININGIDTSKVRLMSYMFAYCPKLTSIDVSQLNTSSVENMCGMFSGCSALPYVDTSNFDTSNVKNMSFMFDDCSSLNNLDVSHFNTSKVLHFGSMFSKCSNVTALDVSGFDTSNAEHIEGMFTDCSSITTLDLSGFNTSNVSSMTKLFSGCSSIRNLDLTSFHTEAVSDMSYMFEDCSSLKNLDISTFQTEQSCNIEGMFKDCVTLRMVDMSGLANVNSYNCLNQYTFQNCKSLILIETPPHLSGDAVGLYQTMYGSDGKQYDHLPIGYSDSITLTLYPILDLNYKGKVCAYVHVIDEQGQSIDSGTLQYSYLDVNNIQQTGETTIDKHGYASFKTDELQYDKSRANKSGIDVRKITFKPVAGSAIQFQEVPVEIHIHPLSYEQKISLSFKPSASIEEGAGVGVSAAIVEEEAKLINGALTAGAGTGLEATFKHAGDKTSLKLKHVMSGKFAASLESGIKQSIFQDNDEEPNASVFNLEGKVTGTNTKGVAMEIEDIHSISSDESTKIGKFLLASLLIDGSQAGTLVDFFTPGKGLNNYVVLRYIQNAGLSLAPIQEDGYEVAVSGKVNAAKIKLPFDESISIASLGGKYSFSTKVQKNNTTQKSTVSSSFNSDINFSSINGKYLKTDIFNPDYATGLTISSEKNGTGAPSISMAIDTGERNYLNVSSEANSITYKSDIRQTDKIWNKICDNPAYEHFNRLVNNQKKTILEPTDYIYYCSALKSLDEPISIESRKKRSTTVGFNLPIGIQAFVGAKIKLDFSGVETRTIDTFEGYVWPDDPTTPILTAEENIEDDVDQHEQEMCEFLYSQVEEAFNGLKDLFDTVSGAADTAVQYGKAIVKAGGDGVATAKNWVIKITGYKNVVDTENASGNKRSTKESSLQKPVSLGLVTGKTEKAAANITDNTATSISIGEPYTIAMEDQDGQPVEDWEGQTLDLTLAYTEEDLAAAELTGDSLNGIGICRYDEDADAYVMVEGTHDANNKSVTATITEKGQYILCIDRIAPSISDIRTAYMDGKYVVLADIHELSKISSFSLKMDDEEIVDGSSFYNYYSQTSGVFCFTLPENLTEGVHTLSFDIADSAGNCLEEPVTYEFSNAKPTFYFYETSVKSGVLTIKGNIDENPDLELVAYYEMELDGERVTNYVFPQMYGTYFECFSQIPEGAVVKSIWIESTDKNGHVCTFIIPEEDWQGTGEDDTVLIDNASVGGISEKTYTGKAITPELNVQLGWETLQEGTDYIVEYKNNTNIGIATAVIIGIGKYTGTVEQSFMIVGDLSKSATKATVASIPAKQFSGSAIKPTPTIKAVGQDGNVVKLIKDRDYTLTYSNNKNVGKATITIKGKGYYTGAKTKTFKINPKGTTLLKPVPAAKAMTVKWKKQATQTTGYEILIATNSKFTLGKKTVKVTKTGTISKKITNLKAKKKYYVKIRTYKTVSGVKYYSAWSKYKTVTTK